MLVLVVANLIIANQIGGFPWKSVVVMTTTLVLLVLTRPLWAVSKKVDTAPELLSDASELSKLLGFHSKPKLWSTTKEVASTGSLGLIKYFTIIVLSTSLSKLSRDEQRSILAHELGHATLRTALLHLCLAGLALSLCVCIEKLTGGGTLAVLVLSYIVLAPVLNFSGRCHEFACDAIATVLVDGHATATGLVKIVYMNHFGDQECPKDLDITTFDLDSLNLPYNSWWSWSLHELVGFILGDGKHPSPARRIAAIQALDAKLALMQPPTAVPAETRP
jgi:Zn-dependent protease with chaperone function